MKSKIIGIILLGAAIGVFGLVMYYNNPNREIPIVFSSRTMLSGLWHTYTETILEKDTFRTLDAERDYVTTSEGQSYTMIRAVWMDDKEVFDKSWQWTKDNLQHEEGDVLFSWLFGKKPDGTYGILTAEGGGNTASDADSDIALALVFAYSRWGDQVYLDDARTLIKDIWEKEVIMINGKPYLLANNVEKTSKSQWVLINPSYLAPYAYRVFSQTDPDHDWGKLVDTSYEIIDQSITDPLDTGRGVLPPDWIEINAKSGEIRVAPRETLKSTYSYDAIRIPFRLALDYEWYRDERVRNILAKMDFLGTEWKTNGKLKAGYSHAGAPIFDFESPAMYGGSLGYFMVMEPQSAEEIYKSKLESLYDPDVQGWKQAPGYYDSNIVWFALALYNHALPNLAENLNLPTT